MSGSLLLAPICLPAPQAKHLDWEAPALQYVLHHQELAGHWGRAGASTRCSLAPFQPDNITSWRAWRNAQPDVRLTGSI
jgi:hypothetical protein